MDTTDWESVFQLVNRDVCSPNQIPTPPVSNYLPRISPILSAHDRRSQRSHEGSPSTAHDAEDAAPLDIINVSSTFFPGASVHSLPPDLILLSSDQVFFYVHSHILLNASMNNFCSLLPLSPRNIARTPSHIGTPGSNSAPSPAPLDDSLNPQNQPVLNMPQHSTVLNIILHAIYDLSCAHYSPPVDTLITAVEEMPGLGLPLKTLISPNTALYNLILSYAPLYPLQLYALAAHHDLSDLAVPISSHLLSFSLPQLEDSMAERIGPIYLKRLFFLHFGRMEALKRILLNPPHPHAPTSYCDFTDQKKLTRAWALASAYLAWDARPDISTSAMESALNPLIEHLSCELCKQSMRERVKNLVVQWSVVRVRHDHLVPSSCTP